MGAISQEIIEVLRGKLPDFFPRSRIEELTNGLLSKGWMYNLERANKGPRAHRMGRQIYYMRDEFVDWLVNYYRGMSDEYSKPRAEVHRGETTENGA